MTNRPQRKALVHAAAFIGQGKDTRGDIETRVPIYTVSNAKEGKNSILGENMLIGLCGG